MEQTPTGTATSPPTATPTQTQTTGQAATTTANGPAVIVEVAGSTDAVVPVGETRAGRISLVEAPNGLEAYKVTVTIEDPDICTFAGVTVPEQYGGVVDESTSNDGATATCAVFSAGLSGEHTDVRLGTVEISGDAVGETTLDVSPSDFVDGNDEQFFPVSQVKPMTISEG